MLSINNCVIVTGELLAHAELWAQWLNIICILAWLSPFNKSSAVTHKGIILATVGLRILSRLSIDRKTQDILPL